MITPRPLASSWLGSSPILLLAILCYLLTTTQLVPQVHTQQVPPELAPRSPCPRAFKINTNSQYRRTLHFICLQRRPNANPNLDVIQYFDRRTIVSIPIREIEINQMASFVDEEGTLRVLISVPDRLNGTSMYSIDPDGNYIKESHTVNTQLVSTMTIWKLELNWQWHLATANQPYLPDTILDNANLRTRKPLPELGTMITIHSWRMSYFDNYQTITLPFDGHVNKLEPMHINDQEFLIVAMESRKEAYNHGGQSRYSKSDSIIYKLDFGQGTLDWVHYQYLGTKHALDVSSFTITHRNSLQRDYYIAVVGQSEPTLDGKPHESGSTEHGLIIYKYLGDRFIKTRSIPVPGATKIDTLSYGVGDTYVIIALMSEWPKRVSLFLFDGLNLNPAPAPRLPVAPTPPPFARPPIQATGQRYQRTLNSDGFRLFEMPSIMPDQVNGTYKRTLDEMLTDTLPALVFSTIQDTADTNTYDGFENDTNNQKTQDILFQVPIIEMIAENEAKLGKPDEGQHTKRNFIAMGPAEDLLGWCKNKISGILADAFEYSAQNLASLPRVDQNRPIELRGDLVIEGNLHISNLLYANKVEDLALQPLPYNPVPLEFSSIFNTIERAHLDIDTVKRRVDELLVDDGSIQEVYTPLRFEKIIFECQNQLDPRYQQGPFVGAVSCPQVGELRAINLNTRDISDIQRQALLTGRSMRISQDIRFEHLVLHGRTSILDSLNDIPIDEIVFKQGHSTGPITGFKNLRSGLYSSSNLVVDSWNGLRVDGQFFLTSNGEQRIDADLKFSHLVLDASPLARNSSRIQVLNGLPLDAHLDQIAQADKPNQFDVPVAVDELIIQGPTYFSANSALSSVDIEEVWRSAMFKHLHQNISAPMHFANEVHVSYGGDILVDKLINGVVLAPDNVLMRNRNYDLPNPIVFEGQLSVRSLQVEKHLNGIQVLQNFDTGRTELAILYDGGRQFLTGDKILHDVKLGGQSNIGGAINGHLNLTQLYNLVRNNGGPFRFGRVRIKGNDIRIADSAHFHVDSFINGIHSNDICMLANRLAQSFGTREQYNRMRFEQPVAFNSLRCASINGFNDLRNSFLMKNGQQRILGALKLMNGVIFNSTVNIAHTFNDLNVTTMSQSITQVINESRTGHKDFYGDLYLDELFANSINGLPLSQVFIAKADYPQAVSAPMTFDHLDIENVLVIGKDLFTRTFNGLNVSDIISNTLQYDAPQVIYNHVELDHLHILPGANLITKSINGQDLRQVYADSVLVDVPQQILAPKVFNGQVDFVDRVFLRFGMDGLSENELKFILLLQSDELIEDDLEFNNDVIVLKSLEIQTGSINDVDVNIFVTSMLSEERQNGLRVLSNSSLRFKDVKLNNLVVTGTIQGIDLSKEALSMSDNQNGTYDSKLRQQQIYLNNQRIFNELHNSQRNEFLVQTNYQNQFYSGMCHIHSCPTTTPLIPIHQVAPTSRPSAPLLPRPAQQFVQQPPLPQPAAWEFPYRPGTDSLAPIGQVNMPAYGGAPLVHHQAPVIVPRPMNILINTSQVGPVWRPQPPVYHVHSNATTIKYDQPDLQQHQYGLLDPAFLQYQALLKAQAISELSTRINKYLTVSFYYEIVQKHPLLGPVLHAARNPILDEEANAWLLLKATVKKGEPCLQRGQKIDVMAEQRHKGSRPTFTVSSHIQETSNPSSVESLVVGQSHYVFISDIYPEGPSETHSQLLVYEWDFGSGMYNLKERIYIDGSPTALKAFVVNNIGCIALANPRVVQSNHSGAPLLYCQHTPMSSFSVRTVMPMHNIFDLDIVALPASSQIIIAALAQQHTEQVGDLIVSQFDVNTRVLRNIAIRRTARPLKLHFVKQAVISDRVLLVVSEGITSNDAAQATTRIFSLHIQGLNAHLLENQIIRDNQFADIQSVILDQKHSMIFLQSTHSISIYAPMRNRVGRNEASCDPHFELVQRVPTKGANKFLAFNNNLPASNLISALPRDHTLVLSSDDCEHQKYWTIILKPKFR